MSVELEKPDINKKLIGQSPFDRLKAQGDGKDDDGLYPNISGWATINGAHSFSHENPENPEASCNENLNADGSYKTSENSNQYKGVNSELSHQSHGYVSRGKSSQVDGHDDSRGESTKRNVTDGDTGKETGGDAYDGSGGKRITGQKEDSFTHTAGGNIYKVQTGQGQNSAEVSYIACDTHNYTEGDNIASVKGNKYTMVKDGDYGVHVQDKNIDFKADSGKAQIKTAKDIIIESDTKITLKVGGSTIVITPTDITITAAGKVNIKASDDVITKGATTKIQGGGAAAPPTTFS